jgi:arginine utilization regulatory protein
MNIDIFKSILENTDSGIAVFENNEIIYKNKPANQILESYKNLKTVDDLMNLNHLKLKDKFFRPFLMPSNDNYEVVKFKDITDEIELSNKNCFFDIIINKISDGIILTDKNGQIFEYNKASEEFEGLKKDYVLGKKTTDLYNVEESTSELLKVLKTGEEILDVNMQFETIRGQEVLLLSNYYPVYNNSNLIGACAISIDYSKIHALLNRTLKLQNNLNKNTRKSSADYSFSCIIGDSDEIKKAKTEAVNASKFDTPVLIVGDTGTGKEMFVQSIHSSSKRSNEPFVPINCAAIPETLMESLLFGTVKGAFTGSETKPGLIEQADSGTLYLDELNSMPINIQAKLLRVIQENKVRRVGGKEPIDVDCRFIASINESPEYCINNNKLRDDLFYRLATTTIEIPGLTERKGDIKVLIDYFIDEYNLKYKCNISGISNELAAVFNEYHWPGNVRELQYVIESAMSMDRNISEIKYEHLPNFLFKKFSGLRFSSISKTYLKNKHLNTILAKTEKEAVLQSLKENDGNITKAAGDLGISRQNLHYRIRKLNIKNKIHD